MFLKKSAFINASRKWDILEMFNSTKHQMVIYDYIMIKEK